MGKIFPVPSSDLSILLLVIRLSRSSAQLFGLLSPWQQSARSVGGSYRSVEGFRSLSGEVPISQWRGSDRSVEGFRSLSGGVPIAQWRGSDNHGQWKGEANVAHCSICGRLKIKKVEGVGGGGAELCFVLILLRSVNIFKVK